MRKLAAVLVLMASSQVAFACQESCVEYAISSRSGKLQDWNAGNPRPIGHAFLVVRETSSGPRTFCGARKGAVIKRIKTRKNGSFSLKGIPAGKYWITYEHPERGESFLVVLNNAHPAQNLDLDVDDSTTSRCYAVDIERNATKPRGWPLPVEKDK